MKKYIFLLCVLAFSSLLLSFDTIKDCTKENPSQKTIDLVGTSWTAKKDGYVFTLVFTSDRHVTQLGYYIESNGEKFGAEEGTFRYDYYENKNGGDLWKEVDGVLYIVGTFSFPSDGKIMYLEISNTGYCDGKYYLVRQ